jgi:RNA polymerase sigma factor (sigma-70 family)
MKAPEAAPPDYKANDDYILQLTRLTPRKSWSMSETEQHRLVGEIQAGSPEAMQTLISQRLRWIYGFAQEHPELQERHDLELADIMQIGCLAVIEAAYRITVNDDQTTRSKLYLAIPLDMGTQLAQSKLVPTISKSNEAEPVYFVDGRDEYRHRVLDLATSVEDGVLELLLSELRYQPEQTSHERAQDIYDDRVVPLLEQLSHRQRQIIEMRYGIDRERPLLLSEVARHFNVTKQLIQKAQKEALIELQTSDLLKDEPASGLDDDTTNYGLGPLDTPAVLAERQRYSAKKAAADAVAQEKLDKQRAWLKEIETKQQMGQIAFVKGSLLKRPLSPEIQQFIDAYDANAKGANPTMDLRRLLE